jgi:phenylalanyl-tRNA synthetase beta chain
VTPNRADCLGIIGVARDVAALNKAPLVEPEIAPVAATINDAADHR